MIDYKSSAIKFKVGDFVLFFPTNIVFETFNDPENYYGIIFNKGHFKYQVLNSKLGTRLLINDQAGYLKDVPFNMKTADMLPEFIKVRLAEGSKAN